MKKILFLGDSITEGFILYQYFPAYLSNWMVNKGVYGDNTDLVFARLQHDVIDLKPDVVFLLIGTNNHSIKTPNQEIADAIKNISSTIKKALPEVIIYLTSILPVRNLDNRNNKDISQINRYLAEICNKEESFIYLDLYNVFLSEEGISRQDSADGLHLTEDGYKKWAKSILPILNNYI